MADLPTTETPTTIAPEKTAPAPGEWSLYSRQKTLPYLNEIGGMLGAHNYVALLDPEGNTRLEMHGTFTKKFTVAGPIAGNYLQVTNWGANQYLPHQSLMSSKYLFSGTQEEMAQKYAQGYNAVANALDQNHQLYDGARIFGHAVNSNSVWNTALSAMGVKDTSLFDGPLSTPGRHVDLRTEPSNNAWLNTPDDVMWRPNPSAHTVYSAAPPITTTTQTAKNKMPPLGATPQLQGTPGM